MTENKPSSLGDLGVTCRDQTLGTLCFEVVMRTQMELIYGGSMHRLNLVNKSIPSTLISISKKLCYVKAKGYPLDMTYQLVVSLNLMGEPCFLSEND